MYVRAMPSIISSRVLGRAANRFLALAAAARGHSCNANEQA